MFNETLNSEPNKTFNSYDLIDMSAKVLGKLAQRSVSFAFNQFSFFSSCNYIIIGIGDASGTVNAFVMNSLFTQDQLVRGNITDLMYGLMDVIMILKLILICSSL